MVVLHVFVGVPARARRAADGAAGVNLHEPHTALEQSPRQQAAPPGVPGVAFPEAVHVADVFRFAVDVAHLRHGQLHAGCQFVAAHAGAQHRVGTAAVGVARIELLQKIPCGGVRSLRLLDGREKVAHRGLAAAQLDTLVL